MVELDGVGSIVGQGPAGGALIELFPPHVHDLLAASACLVPRQNMLQVPFVVPVGLPSVCWRNLHRDYEHSDLHEIKLWIEGFT